jgi:hypothetical protein
MSNVRRSEPRGVTLTIRPWTAIDYVRWRLSLYLGDQDTGDETA